ncbi:MAG: hypothetical protein U0800_09930 [Isosphaeraceae bacterium]
MHQHQSFHDLYRLLKDAVEELEVACKDRVTDPYQCYHWNSVGTLVQTLDTLTACLKVVENRLGPDATERLQFLAQFEQTASPR